MADASDHALYAVGNTLHAQVSSVSDFGASRFWNSAELTAELAASDVLDFTKNRSALDHTRSEASLSLEAYFEPQYFEVLPNLDVRLPIGFSYGLAGDSATSDEVYANAGDFEVGVEATFRTEWEMRLTYAHFLGSPYQLALADRDFISLGIQRTF